MQSFSLETLFSSAGLLGITLWFMRSWMNRIDQKIDALSDTEKRCMERYASKTDIDELRRKGTDTHRRIWERLEALSSENARQHERIAALEQGQRREP